MKLLLTLFISLIALFSHASFFSFTEGPHIEGEISGQFEEFNIRFKTTEEKEITYKWIVIENSFPENWDYSLCDYPNCYFSIPDSGAMETISKEEASNGKSVFFKLNFLSSLAESMGVLKLYVFDSDDLLKGDTVSFTITSKSASLPELNQNLGPSFYPNPTRSTLNVVSTEVGVLKILDPSGKQLLEYKLIVGLNTFDVTSLTSGIYILYFEMSNKQVLKPSKMQIVN